MSCCCGSRWRRGETALCEKRMRLLRFRPNSCWCWPQMRVLETRECRLRALKLVTELLTTYRCLEDGAEQLSTYPMLLLNNTKIHCHCTIRGIARERRSLACRAAVESSAVLRQATSAKNAMPTVVSMKSPASADVQCLLRDSAWVGGLARCRHGKGGLVVDVCRACCVYEEHRCRELIHV